MAEMHLGWKANDSAAKKLPCLSAIKIYLSSNVLSIVPIKDADTPKVLGTRSSFSVGKLERVRKKPLE